MLKPIVWDRKEGESDIEQAYVSPAYFERGQRAFASVEAESTYPSLLRITGLSNDMVRPVVNIGDSLAHVVQQQPQVKALFAREDQVDAATTIGNTMLTSALNHPRAREAIRVAAGDQLREFETRIESLFADGVQVAEDLQDRFTARVRNLEEDMSKRLTTSKLGQTKVIKDLQASLNEQMKLNKTLMARVRKLERGAKE